MRRVRTCHYKVLGISIRASAEEIRKAFRSLALRWHPDRNPSEPDAADRFREILNAYETLIDPGMRGRYDRARGYEKRKRSGSGRSFQTDEDGGSSFNDVFHEFFGISHRRVRERRGTDLRFDLQLPKTVVAEGTFEEITYSRMVFCRDCVGKGRKKPVRTCDRCHGLGEVEDPYTVRVWIPPGSKDGTRLCVQGGGDCLCPGIPPGDLVILLHIVEGQ